MRGIDRSDLPDVLDDSTLVAPAWLGSLGDRAFVAEFSAEVDAGGWAAAVRSHHWPGVVDVVLAYRTVAVFADPERVDLVELESRLKDVTVRGDAGRRGRMVVIPVLYDGPDLDDIAARLELSRDDVIALHSQVSYHVFAIGFLPGFPYAGYLPPALSGLARRSSPRLKVPAGSVAIAGRQTGVYPTESPGGWHLLGTTPVAIADLEEGYFPIKAGDRLRFEPIPAHEFEGRRHEKLGS
jgi:KipI family sensor histidine kinase inhibitor